MMIKFTRTCWTHIWTISGSDMWPKQDSRSREQGPSLKPILLQPHRGERRTPAALLPMRRSSHQQSRALCAAQALRGYAQRSSTHGRCLGAVGVLPFSHQAACSSSACHLGGVKGVRCPGSALGEAAPDVTPGMHGWATTGNYTRRMIRRRTRHAQPRKERDGTRTPPCGRTPLFLVRHGTTVSYTYHHDERQSGTDEPFLEEEEEEEEERLDTVFSREQKQCLEADARVDVSNKGRFTRLCCTLTGFRKSASRVICRTGLIEASSSSTTGRHFS